MWGWGLEPKPTRYERVALTIELQPLSTYPDGI